MNTTEESLKELQKSFDEFFANNYAEAAVIDSMRNRLIGNKKTKLVGYGTSILRDELAANMLKRPALDKLIVSLPKKDALDNSKRVIQLHIGTYDLSYFLVTPDDKLIGIEIDFNLYQLHWGICIYSKDPMLGWSGSSDLQTFASDNNYKPLDYAGLGDYAKKKGVIVDDNRYQQELIKANTKDKMYTIASVQVTGDRNKDADNIAKKLEEIILKLLGEEAASSAITDPEPKPGGEYNWKTLCDDYRSQHLLETPTKIKTFLEIAGIQSKEVYISRILEFFLDANEHHPFGNIFVRSFHNLYGAKSEKGNKKEQESSKYVKVVDTHTEYKTNNNKRIDILVETDNYVLAIENKIYAGLYNDLEDYKKTATDVARGIIGKDADAVSEEGGKDVPEEDAKEVVCVVLAPFAMSKVDQEKIKKEDFVFITYEELFNEVIKHFNEVDVYHKNKHFLYMQLFYDLFRTIKNLTGEEKLKEKFANFIGQENKAYWAIQAIHSCISYKNSVLEKVKEEVISKLEGIMHGSFFNWYGEEQEAIDRASKNYATFNKEYMPTHILAYDTCKHQINEESVSLAIDIGFDSGTGSWQMDYFFRGVKYSREHLEEIKKFMRDHKFDVLSAGDATDADQRYRIQLHPQPTKEATEKLITDLLINSICKLEGS